MRRLACIAVAGMVMLSTAHVRARDAKSASGGEVLAGLFGGPFSLVDQTGRPRTERDFGGRFLLLTFGYTACPDICPITLDTMVRALDRLGLEAERVQPIFVTLDPARDTPASLGAYLAAIDSRVIGLSGSEAEIGAAAKAFRVHRMKVAPDPTHPEHYLLDHGSLTYLMDPEGRFLTLFPFGTADERMADVLRHYLKGAG